MCQALPGPGLRDICVNYRKMLPGWIQQWAHGLVSRSRAGFWPLLVPYPGHLCAVHKLPKCMPYPWEHAACFLRATPLNLPLHNSPMGQIQFCWTDEETEVQSCDVVSRRRSNVQMGVLWLQIQRLAKYKAE